MIKRKVAILSPVLLTELRIDIYPPWMVKTTSGSPDPICLRDGPTSKVNTATSPLNLVHWKLATRRLSRGQSFLSPTDVKTRCENLPIRTFTALTTYMVITHSQARYWLVADTGFTVCGRGTDKLFLCYGRRCLKPANSMSCLQCPFALHTFNRA